MAQSQVSNKITANYTRTVIKVKTKVFRNIISEKTNIVKPMFGTLLHILSIMYCVLSYYSLISKRFSTSARFMEH